MLLLDSLSKAILEGMIFIITTIFLFNEFTVLLQTFGLFTAAIAKQIGLISAALAAHNLISRTFFGIEIR